MKRFVYYFAVSLLFLSGSSWIHFWSVKAGIWPKGDSVVLADEDEEEGDDEEERSGESAKTETETITNYVKLPDQIVTKEITTIIYDSDGDGVYDSDDLNPTIHNTLIVEDKNFNGIADAYENGE